MKLPTSVLKLVHAGQKIRISRIENHFELEYPNGEPIVVSTSFEAKSTASA
jgi:hypothetical protein